ncbi:bifunctional SulP family inorganic anion transporter/carbonic anhydrase [Symmachiella dynata]|uniref:Carbonic anhydrase 2 n=1 Tax=Symmachiella dynata TaxID=2527995 RepID=A0A517ZY56_9PLAN|nr:SulP family inorganic anion transporter [Symmachiella dynata]QDU47410.1 Carbonic anhydrase 2 [Symmachiella dynata]
MTEQLSKKSGTLVNDLTASVVVFIVALPLCLGIALASEAPLFSGVLSGIIGGIVVGFLSRSHTSVSGPAAGLTAIVAAQIAVLGSFEAFLLAVMIAGAMQVAAGLARAGSIAMFVPNSVIKGLLTAIGIILILKQFPHVLGHDDDVEGEMSFTQPDQENTFTELLSVFQGQWHLGAASIGILSVAILVAWSRIKFLKNSPVPAPLIVVLVGLGLGQLFRGWGAGWLIGSTHLVQVPVAESLSEFSSFLTHPDFSAWSNPQIYIAAVTIAIVASLETVLNLEATDRLDPQQRQSPPSRELIAQGVGNMTTGLIGGIPMTSVIVRSSVNINSGGKTKLSAIIHGCLLLASVSLAPQVLNQIPLSCLAAILLVTGFKLASPELFRQMYKEGKYQFTPFLITVLAIVFTDLLVGILIGLGVSLSFILYSNVKRPLRRVVENHVGGEVLRIELSNQVSFLNRASLVQALDGIPQGGSVLIDARNSSYIDPDVLGLLHDFKNTSAPARGISVSLLGFRNRYFLEDEIQYIDYSTHELQERLTADQVLEMLIAGNERFRSGNTLTRHTIRQINATATAQHPLAVVVSCMDSRAPVEMIFDVGVGDVFVVRVAGNVISPEVLASIEYGCVIARAPLVLVMGHTNCGAVTATVDAICGLSFNDAGCSHLKYIVDEVSPSIDGLSHFNAEQASEEDKIAFVNQVSERNVQHSVDAILQRSPAISEQVRNGQAAVVGAMYDVNTGQLHCQDVNETAKA